MDKYAITPIGTIKTGYSDKFGIPRQSGLVPATQIVRLNESFKNTECFKGLEGYSHIWLIWIFSENINAKKHDTVRPPRLGGNVRVGVFASRSPYRPNNIGMSLVELIEYGQDKTGVYLKVKGADMLDNTPIIDIKPYLPYVESIPDAKGGYALEKSKENLKVSILPEVKDYINNIQKKHPEKKEIFDSIIKLISLNPKPHYHDDKNRVYKMEYNNFKISFKIDNCEAYITKIEKT